VIPAKFFGSRAGDPHEVQGNGEVSGTALEQSKYRDAAIHPA
jgi:acetamidase/formamidase